MLGASHAKCLDTDKRTADAFLQPSMMREQSVRAAIANS